MTFKELLFGTAGTPVCTKGSGSVAGIATVRELGLDCLELEFVRGVRMGLDKAAEVKEAAKKNNIVLSAHGPYYINLNSDEKEKIQASIKRILETARIGNAAGAFSCTFHAAFYMKQDPSKVYGIVKKHMQKIVKTLKDESNPIWVRPETTGKGTQWGDLKEIVKMSQEVEQVMPCIDFAHLHARTGKDNSLDEFREMLAYVEKKLGKKALNNMHIHMAGIEYGPKGERNHLELKDSDFRYKDLMKAFREFRIKGVVISESPNIEEDASLMKKAYNSI